MKNQRDKRDVCECGHRRELHDDMTCISGPSYRQDPPYCAYWEQLGQIGENGYFGCCMQEILAKNENPHVGPIVFRLNTPFVCVRLIMIGSKDPSSPLSLLPKDIVEHILTFLRGRPIRHRNIVT